MGVEVSGSKIATHALTIVLQELTATNELFRAFSQVPVITQSLGANQTTFIGRAAHPSFGTEMVDGRIALEGWRLTFTSSDESAVEIPLNQLEITIGESGEITFQDLNQPDCVLYTFDSRILDQRVFLQQPHTRAQVRAIRENADTKWRVKVTVWALAIIAVLAIATPIVMGFVVRALVARVPASVEQRMGAKALADLQDKMPFINDPVLQTKLNTAVTPLLAAVPSGTNYTFYIGDDNSPNAFALPDGSVVVTRGLLTMCDRPEEISAAVAHEIAHVTERHATRQIISALGPIMLFELFASSNSRLVGTLGAVSQIMLIQGFSQEHELEADAVGWHYLLSARINPHAMIDLLHKLDAFETRQKRDGPHIAALRSHPATAKRIDRLESEWKKVKNKTGFVEFGSP